MDCGFGDSRGSANNGGGDSCPTENTLLTTEVEEQSDLLRQHRALIFFQTKNMLNLVTRLLNTEFKSLVHLRLDGSVSLGAPEALISLLTADPSFDALLLTTAVGGLDFNLTGAGTVIHAATFRPASRGLHLPSPHPACALISQPNNRVLGEMDTSRMIHNMAAAVKGEGASALSDNGGGGSGGKGPSWGDVEAGEYAAEYDMREFLARLPRDGC
uniref:TATA binding protein associated factor 172 n=1 Tax=Echinococcus granulosus TaxID=6210 RepID=A0A068X0D0_ECHGR|nr:TATA binding protein associated factor 172 [Echinococcus granulosus]